ncbi:MAG: carbohydrate porin, partial [Alphaproteobacteria bacterium]
FDRREDDALGVAIAIANAGGVYQALEPLAKTREINVEATYRTPVTNWLALQGDVQYIVNPGLAADVGNALLFGLRVEVSHGWAWR